MCWEARSPCGNGELTSNLHIFWWYIIIKEKPGRGCSWRRTGGSCRLWPWVHLGPSVQGIPASPACPEHRGKVTQSRATNSKVSVSRPSLEKPRHKTNQQNKNIPLRKLMKQKAESRSQPQSFPWLTRVVGSFVFVCSSHWWLNFGRLNEAESQRLLSVVQPPDKLHSHSELYLFTSPSKSTWSYSLSMEIWQNMYIWQISVKLTTTARFHCKNTSLRTLNVWNNN